MNILQIIVAMFLMFCMVVLLGVLVALVYDIIRRGKEENSSYSEPCTCPQCRPDLYRQWQPEPRRIEQKPERYTVIAPTMSRIEQRAERVQLPQPKATLPVSRKLLEVKR